MIFMRVIIFLFFLFVGAYAKLESKWDGFVSVEYVPSESDIVRMSYDPYDSQLESYLTYEVVFPVQMKSYKAVGVGGVFTDSYEIKTLIEDAPLKLGGIFILICDDILLPYNETSPISHEFLDAKASKFDNPETIKNKIKNGYLGVKLVNPTSSEMMILNNWKGKLKKYGFKFDYIFWAEYKNKHRIIILKEYGEKKLSYSVYGVFKDRRLAKKYGFSGENDHDYYVFMQKRKEILPVAEDPGGLLYGVKVFKYKDIVNNKKKYFEELTWSQEPIYSEIEVEYNDNGYALKYKNKYEIPPAPDSKDNENPEALCDCPDRKWYYALYKTCLKEKMGYTQKKLNPALFSDFTDYVNIEVGKDIYDGMNYNKDGSIAPEYVSTDNPPAPVMLFDKNCNLISDPKHKLTFDLEDKKLKYGLYKRIYASFSGGHLVEGKYKFVNLSHRFKKCISSLKDVYNSTLKETPPRIIDSKYFVSKDLIKKDLWENYGNAYFFIDGKENLKSLDWYKTHDWYLGNPFAKYKPYESSNDFIFFDRYRMETQKPLKVISLLLENNIWHDYNSALLGWNLDHFELKKKWFVLWKWPIIYKHKDDYLSQAGYLYCWSPLVFDNGREFQNSGYKYKNENCVFKGKVFNLKTGDWASYDPNGKDYTTDQNDPSDRNPEIDKGEAMKEIAIKIAVAEGMVLASKGLTQLGQSNKVAKIADELNKRIMSTWMYKALYNTAKEAITFYLLLQQTLDIFAEIRDAGIALGETYQGLAIASDDIKSYYKDFKWKSVKLTNCTKILPDSKFYAFDSYLSAFQNQLIDAQKTLKELGLLSYGMYAYYGFSIKDPLCSAVKQNLAKTIISSGKQTSEELAKSEADMDFMNAKMDKWIPSSVKAFVTWTLDENNQLLNSKYRLMNDKTNNMALALYIVENESNSWERYKGYMAKTLTLDSLEKTAIKCGEEESFWPAIIAFSPPDLFSPVISRELSALAGVTP